MILRVPVLYIVMPVLILSRVSVLYTFIRNDKNELNLVSGFLMEYMS